MHLQNIHTAPKRHSIQIEIRTFATEEHFLKFRTAVKPLKFRVQAIYNLSENMFFTWF